MLHSPCRSNCSNSSRHHDPYNAVDGLETPDRAGEEHGWQDEPQQIVDCCVGVGGLFFALFCAMMMKADVVRHPLLK